MMMMILRIFIAVLAISVAASAQAPAPALPDSIAVRGQRVILTLNAYGAQVYECKMGEAGKLTWHFREPVATLVENGMTVGRHYAGPTWEHDDLSWVAATPVGRASGATPADVPLLKLEVTNSQGPGVLAGAAVIQRINTKGGQLEGNCDKAGALQPVAYSADYVFLGR
jgi:hypothetical protein